MAVAAAALVAGCATADKQAPKNTINQEEVMSKLTLEDKAHFVIGTGMAGFSGNDAVIGATRNLVSGSWCRWYHLPTRLDGHPCCSAGRRSCRTAYRR